PEYIRVCWAENYYDYDISPWLLALSLGGIAMGLMLVRE
ncbi:unnamed protein product, partial [marine sediment metagenome]